MSLPKKDKPYESWRAVRDIEAVRNSVLSVLKELTSPPGDDGVSPHDGTSYEAHLKSWIAANSVDSKQYKFD